MSWHQLTTGGLRYGYDLALGSLLVVYQQFVAFKLSHASRRMDLGSNLRSDSEWVDNLALSQSEGY